MNKLRLYIYIISLFLWCSNLLAQNPAYFKIGETEFANTNIYTLLFDEQTDVLYIGTNTGLYAYKQNSFIRLKGPEEQVGISLFALKQNNKGEVFCINLNGQLFKIEENSFILYYQVPEEESINLFSYFFIENDKIVITTSETVKLLSTDGHVLEHILNSKEFTQSLKGNSIYSVSQTTNNTIYITFNNSNTVFTYDKQELDSITVNFKNINAYSSFFIFNDNLLSICKGGNLNSSSSYIYQDFTPNNKEQVYQFSTDELIGVNQKQGVHFLKIENDTLFESQHFFDDLFISTFSKKENGTLFFGTFGEGVIVVPDKDNIAPVFDHLFLGITSSPSNDVFLSTRSGKVFSYKNDLKLIDEHNVNIDHVFSIYGDFSFDSIRQKGILYPIDYTIKDVAQISHQYILEATSEKVLIRVDKKSSFPKDLDFIYTSIDSLSYVVFTGKRSYAVCWDAKDSLIYHSTGFGVYSKEWSTLKRDTLLFKNKPFLAIDLEIYDDLLVCATGNNGLLFFKNNQFSFQLSEKDGLNSNALNKIKIKGDQLFILSKKGIQLYDFKLNIFIQPGVKEGVFNTGITNFALSDDKLWLLEKHRFYSIDLVKLSDKEMIGQLYIDSITINNQLIDYRNEKTFSYHENALKIYFDYRDIETKRETKIMYLLEGLHDDWSALSTTQNVINFQYLPKGKYVFKIKSVYRGQETKPFIYAFRIYAPFWQQWWFLIGLTLLAIAIVLLFNKRKAGKLRKENIVQLEKEKLKTSLLDSELKALRSQMNPHFIFNSLNSIQDLILREDTDASYDYIVLFADLVRSTLNYSSQDFIPLEKEMEFLNVYLTLERLRFEDDFTYSLDSEDDLNIKIPSLIVQPFIENALQHGLLHKKGQKRLSLNFKLTDKLTCTIIDNGIGRKAAKKIQQRQGENHESFALKAIEKRLSILSTKNNFEAGYSIEDLYKNGTAIGTKVVVTIPHKMMF